ncbi:MAG: bifunctional precorrin-2 dehydrogenase/sirohydrochlorin ferrochelatase [Alphaproteobacteria bacterium]
MYPVALNLAKIPVLLVGSGELIARRVRMLEEAGANDITVTEHASAADIAKASIVMVAGLPRDEAERITTTARIAGKLVNVEDVNDLCDFYFTANVRRGDLIIAVSTSGASPTLARKVRDAIGRIFGEEWEVRVQEAAEKRAEWKKQGKSMQEMMAASEALIEEKGWLP